MIIFFFFFNDTATTEIYTLSLHDALPIFTATGSPDSRPKKSASIPDEKKHIGSWAVPGAASAQSLESTTSAALPSGATLTEPHPVAWKNADRTSFKIGRASCRERV